MMKKIITTMTVLVLAFICVDAPRAFGAEARLIVQGANDRIVVGEFEVK